MNKKASMLSAIAYLIAIICIALVLYKVITFSVETTPGVEVRKAANSFDYAFNAPEDVSVVHAFPGSYFEGCGIGAVMFNVKRGDGSIDPGSHLAISRCGYGCYQYYNIMIGIVGGSIALETIPWAKQILGGAGGEDRILRELAQDELDDYAEQMGRRISRREAIEKVGDYGWRSAAQGTGIQAEGLEGVTRKMAYREMRDNLDSPISHAIATEFPDKSDEIIESTAREVSEELPESGGVSQKRFRRVFKEELKSAIDDATSGSFKEGVWKEISGTLTARSLRRRYKIINILRRTKSRWATYIRVTATGPGFAAVGRGMAIDTANAATGGWFRENLLGLPSPATYLGACCFETSFAKRQMLETLDFASAGPAMLMSSTGIVTEAGMSIAQVAIEAFILETYWSEFGKCLKDVSYYDYLANPSLRVELPEGQDKVKKVWAGKVVLRNHISSPTYISIRKFSDSEEVVVRGK